jgi:putative membrane protein
MALQRGPLARRFGVVDLVLHTTSGPVSPKVIQAGIAEGKALLDAQATRARAARRRQTSEHWLEQVTPLVLGPGPGAGAADPAGPAETAPAKTAPSEAVPAAATRNQKPVTTEGPQHG